MKRKVLFRLPINQDLKLPLIEDILFLLDDFDPIGGENVVPLPADKGFFYNDFEMQFNSNYTKNYYFNFKTTLGQFYSGNRVSFNSEITYRIQPKFSSSVKLRYDDIYFPSEYTYGKLFLIGPKLEYTFNKKLFGIHLFNTVLDLII